MLHVILLILKIIGLVILAVLGLLLLVLLVVLLVPVRYRLKANHGESLFIMGTVSWLFHLLHASVNNLEGTFHIRVRLLGFILYDNQRPPKPKVKKRVRPARKKSEKSKRQESALLQTSGEERLTLKEQPISNITQMEDISKEEKVPIPEVSEDINQTSDDMLKAEDNNTEINITEDKITENNNTENNNTENNNTESKNINNKNTEDNYSGNKLIRQVKAFFRRLISFYHKRKDGMISAFHKIRDKIKRIIEVVTDLKNKWDLIYEFFADELNKQGMHITFKSLKKLLKHILPTKLKSEIIFGTGDPYSTGQILSILCMLYGIYGDKITIVPDFENSRFEGRHNARGRVRAASILIIAVKLILDKKFKYLKNNFILLKEAL